MPPAVGAQSLNHWPPGKSQDLYFLRGNVVMYFVGQVFTYLGVMAGRHMIYKDGGEGMGLATD